MLKYLINSTLLTDDVVLANNCTIPLYYVTADDSYDGDADDGNGTGAAVIADEGVTVADGSDNKQQHGDDRSR